MKISRTFQFSSHIKPEDYEKYIKLEDVIDDEEEQLRYEFTHYRHPKREDIKEDQKKWRIPKYKQLLERNKNLKSKLNIQQLQKKQYENNRSQSSNQQKRNISYQQTQGSFFQTQNNFKDIQTTQQQNDLTNNNKRQFQNSQIIQQNQSTNQVKNGILQKPMNQTFSQKSNNQFNNNHMSTNAHTTSTKTLKFDPQTTIQQYTNNFFQENNTDSYQQTAKTIPRIINTPLTAPTSQQQQRNSQQKKQYKLQQLQESSNNQKARKCSILSGNSNLDLYQQNMSVYNRSPGKKQIQNQNQFYQTSPQKLQQNFQQKSENQMQVNSTQKTNKNSQIKIQVQDQQQYSEINGFNEKEQFNQKNEIMDDFQQAQYIKSQQKFYQTMGIRKQQKENKKKTDQSEKLKEFEIDRRDTHQQMIKKSEKQIMHLKREFQKLRKKNADPTYGENFQSQNNKKQQIRTKALIQPEIFTQQELQQLADEEQQIETEAINKKLAKEEEQQKLKGYSAFVDRFQATNTDQLKYQNQSFGIEVVEGLSFANPEKPIFQNRKPLYTNIKKQDDVNSFDYQKKLEKQLSQYKKIQFMSRPQSAVNINLKYKKYNSIKLKEKQFDEIEKGEQILLSKCKSQFDKIDKMQKTWNNFGIMGTNSNKLRSESMKYVKQLKLINQINKQFKPSEKLILKEQSHGKKPENGETLNQFMDKMFKNPNISNKQFKVVKNLELHQNRIKTMDKNCVITASHSKNLGKFERNGDLY